MTFVSALCESNRQGRGAWERFAAHRARVTALLAEVATPGASLCLLGAGNLNDVDLGRVERAYAAVVLADADERSLRAGLARQLPAAGPHGPQLRIAAPVDLGGVLGSLPLGEPPDAGAAAALVRWLAGAPPPALPGAPFTVTASTGLLTQLLQSVVESSFDARSSVAVRLALRDRHLRDLVSLTAPGGHAVLVTDVVATTTAPALLSTPPERLEPAMTELVAAGNFFTGVNPYRLVAVLEEDERVAAVRLADPWLWPVTADRAHLTCAVVAQTR